MAEVLKKDKVILKLSFEQRVILEKAVKFNSDNHLAGTNSYRNELIRSYLDSTANKDTIILTYGDFEKCFGLLLENFRYLTEKEEEFTDV